LNMFKLLQMVSKIGPKIALGILSTLNSNQIKLAIMRKDLDVLCKAPGIGKKTAERIILELKDRIDKDIIIEEDNISDLNYDNYMEAINGLMSLGYTRIEVEKIIKTMDISNMSIEDIIRETLKRLSKH
ncbi:MAG TPA: Holliday junction branch migration protein RuvA, partial [Tissierella sp.]|nr:Holliday junction branch migration protein RuvA [Tissierella sp.]